MHCITSSQLLFYPLTSVTVTHAGITSFACHSVTASGVMTFLLIASMVTTDNLVTSGDPLVIAFSQMVTP